MDFIELCNRLAALAKPSLAGLHRAQGMNDRFVDLGVDSLDGAVMVMFVCEIFGIDDATSRRMQPKSVQELFDLVMQHKTRDPESVEAAVAMIK